jgi:glycosyltransferase involved in cell wall biosynthesis
MMLSSNKPENEPGTEEVNSISLVLLSYNGQQYLKEKVNFLIKELSFFPHHELIIIDDNSSDGSKEIIDHFRNTENIRIIAKSEHKGIPHTMNLAVENAKYDYIVFCDQRQDLSGNIIQRIVEPLKYKEIGAVSACISDIDKGNCCSRIRKYENFIKSKQSKSGNLIGVYGPLYAIKKECYSVIPDYIILDDLYLSLKILKSKQIRILADCRIIDDDPSILYDYNRIRRYLYGFLQLMKEKSLFSHLNNRQLIMLLWHKYLRLLIPFFLFLSYISAGILGISHAEYLILFGILTTVVIISMLPAISIIQIRLKHIIKINFYYCIALVDVFINQLSLSKISANKSI